MGTLRATLLLAKLCIAAVALRSKVETHRPEPTIKSGATFDKPNTETSYDIGYTRAPPKGLHGKNLIHVGDSNDRELVEYMCSLYGGKMKIIQKMTCGNETLDVPGYFDWDDDTHTTFHFYSNSATEVCDIPEYNMSIVTFFFFGVLTMLPEPKWHFETLRGYSGFSNLLPNISTTGWRDLSPSFMLCFWKSTLERVVPQRPAVMVADSSLWDSVVASQFAESHKKSQAQEAWQLDGWNQFDMLAVLEKWQWMDKATKFMEAMLDGFKPQQLYWRTNPNCPLDPLHLGISFVSKAQAVAVRWMVNSRVGVWKDVGLIDWSSRYASLPADCRFVHYTADGYSTFVNMTYEMWDEAM